jgi:hypothetical protein
MKSEELTATGGSVSPFLPLSSSQKLSEASGHSFADRTHSHFRHPPFKPCLAPSIENCTGEKLQRRPAATGPVGRPPSRNSPF